MWSSLQDATAPAATAVAAAPMGRAAWERVRAAWRAAHIFAAFFERCPYGARRLLAPAFYSQMGLEASAARAICSTPCAPSAEASKELLPSFLAAQGRARRLFAQSVRGKLYGMASGRSRRGVVGRRARLLPGLPRPKTSGFGGASVLQAASSLAAESLLRRCVSRTYAHSSEERRYSDAEQPARWLQPRVTVKRAVIDF